MVYIPFEKKTSRSKQLIKVLSIITALIFLAFALYSFVLYLTQDHFEKLISSDKPFHILIAGLDKNNEADLIFSIRLNPKSKNIGLMFLHPDACLERDSETVSKLFAENDEKDVKESLESIFKEEIKYIVKIKQKKAYKIISILEGLRFYFPGEIKNYKNKLLFKRAFTYLSADLLMDYAAYLDKNNKIGKVHRIYHQQNIILSFLNQKKRFLKILDNSSILLVLLKMIDTTPNFSREDAKYFVNFLSDKNKKAYLYNFSLKLEKNNKEEKLLLLKNKSRLTAENFFKKLDKVSGFKKNKNLRVQVLNAVEFHSNGLARRISSFLKMKGFKTILPANYPKGYLKSTVILDHSGYPYFAMSLAKTLGLPSSIVVENINPDKGMIDATIIIGENIPKKWKRKK